MNCAHFSCCRTSITEDFATIAEINSRGDAVFRHVHLGGAEVLVGRRSGAAVLVANLIDIWLLVARAHTENVVAHTINFTTDVKAIELADAGTSWVTDLLALAAVEDQRNTVSDIGQGTFRGAVCVLVIVTRLAAARVIGI